MMTLIHLTNQMLDGQLLWIPFKLSGSEMISLDSAH